MDIIDRINELLEIEGMTTYAFAKKIGVGDQTIRNFLKARKNYPSYPIILKICQAFNWVDANWLLTGEGVMRKKSGEGVSLELESVKYVRELTLKIVDLATENALLKEKNKTLNLLLKESGKDIHTNQI